MATIAEARRAKDDLKARLGRPAWLRGIGVASKVRDDFSVQVNVASESDAIRSTIPKSIGGVPVHVEVVGTISRRTSARSV
jgi:hypothetical protein